MKNIWNLIGAISIIAALTLICSVVFAEIEKVDDTHYRTTESMVVTHDLKFRKDFVNALREDIVRKQKEIADLQAQIVILNKETADAEALGVKMEAVTAIDGGSK